MKELEQKVLNWAFERGLLSEGDATTQFMKTLEEVSQLGSAIEAKDEDDVKYYIGETLLTLIIQANKHNTTLEDCLASAYDDLS